MKHIIIILLTLFLIGACATSQELNYRPVDSKDLWNIRIEKGTVSGQFEVYINDELVLEETPSMISETINEKTYYKNYEIRLVVNKTTSWIEGDSQKLALYIDNELITQMDF